MFLLFLFYFFFFFFFFFQAEDGIRDWSVTGVQTCALPISAGRPSSDEHAVVRRGGDADSRAAGFPARELRRSEERRVGKECRARGAQKHEKGKEKIARQERKRKRRTSNAYQPRKRKSALKE